MTPFSLNANVHNFVQLHQQPLQVALPPTAEPSAAAQFQQEVNASVAAIILATSHAQPAAPAPSLPLPAPTSATALASLMHAQPAAPASSLPLPAPTSATALASLMHALTNGGVVPQFVLPQQQPAHQYLSLPYGTLGSYHAAPQQLQTIMARLVHEHEQQVLAQIRASELAAMQQAAAAIQSVVLQAGVIAAHDAAQSMMVTLAANEERRRQEREERQATRLRRRAAEASREQQQTSADAGANVEHAAAAAPLQQHDGDAGKPSSVEERTYDGC